MFRSARAAIALVGAGVDLAALLIAVAILERRDAAADLALAGLTVRRGVGDRAGDCGRGSEGPYGQTNGQRDSLERFDQPLEARAHRRNLCGLPEDAPDGRGHRGSISLDLAPGEAENVEAEELQARVAGPVHLEGRAAAVRLPAVQLDDQPLGAQRKSTTNRSTRTFTSGWGMR